MQSHNLSLTPLPLKLEKTMRSEFRIKTKKNTIITIAICVFIVPFLISLLFSAAAHATESALTNLNAKLSNQSVALPAKLDSLTLASTISDNNLSNPYISVVQSGTANTSKITVTSNPVGKIVKVDIRIDNVSSGFWGWSLPIISWNPAVMNLKNVQEGAFLADNTGASALFVGNSPLLWNNTRGEIDGGLSEALSSADTSVDSSGVLATLTFKIINYGNSSVTVSGAYIVMSFNQATSGPHVNVDCNNATIVVLSTDSSSVEFRTWLIIPVIVIPLVGILVYLWKKKSAEASSAQKPA